MVELGRVLLHCGFGGADSPVRRSIASVGARPAAGPAAAQQGQQPPESQQQRAGRAAVPAAAPYPAATRTIGRADRALSRCSVGPGADRIDLSIEVTLAARWSEKNPNLKGAALEEAMQKQPWDASVKGLTSVPQVLAMMNEKLDWTNQLGEAFLAQPDDIQNAVQALRAKADEAGNLKSSKEQKVRRVAAPPSTGYVGPPEYFVIEPVEPDYIYVPVYDPVVVYGPGYWSPAYVPFFWYPPWWTVGPAFGFGAALFVGPALWYHYNWGNRGFAAIQTNTVLYSKFNKVNVSGGGLQSWKFDPAHHGGVQFKKTNLQHQYGNLGGKGVQGIQTGKGIQGIQTGKGVQGVQTDKGTKGIQTSKQIQGVQTGKHIKVFRLANRSKVSRLANTSKVFRLATTSKECRLANKSKVFRLANRCKGCRLADASKGFRLARATKAKAKGVIDQLLD